MSLQRGRFFDSQKGRQRRCLTSMPTRIPTPTATASVTSGRCLTSLERRCKASLPSFAASLPIFAASSPKELAPPRNRSAMLLNTAATVSPTWSAVSTALAEVRTPIRSNAFPSTASAVRFHGHWRTSGGNIRIDQTSRALLRSLGALLLTANARGTHRRQPLTPRPTFQHSS